MQPLRVGIAVLCCACAIGAQGCSLGSERAQRIALVEGLQLFDSLLPVAPDSVVELYSRFDPSSFHTRYAPELAHVKHFIDSMNAALPREAQIDTIAIDHSIESVGNAARHGNTIYLSSSYFFLFNDVNVLRSVVTHEFGHIHFDQLGAQQRPELHAVWRLLQERALFYLFRDGEYSGNARFGGHPDESPAELFASAFNIFNNQREEFAARLRYVDPQHHPLINRLQALILRQR